LGRIGYLALKSQAIQISPLQGGSCCRHVEPPGKDSRLRSRFPAGRGAPRKRASFGVHVGPRVESKKEFLYAEVLGGEIWVKLARELFSLVGAKVTTSSKEGLELLQDILVYGGWQPAPQLRFPCSPIEALNLI
jgi:hypothetical protein